MMGIVGSNIKSISFIDDEVDMIDFTVNDVHCFYGNGIICHNCSEEIVCAGNMAREDGFLYPVKHGHTTQVILYYWCAY